MLHMAALAEPAGKFASSRGLARALQTRHQDDRRGLSRQRQLARVGPEIPAHQGREFAMHHADQRLTRREAASHLFAKRLFLDLGQEVAHHR